MATDNDFDPEAPIGGNTAKPTVEQLDKAHAIKIKELIAQLNAAMGAAAAHGLKVDIEITTRHHIGVQAPPVAQAFLSRPL